MPNKHPLLRYIEERKTTRSRIAELAGTSPMTIGRIIAGRQNATMDLLKRISAATGNEVSIAALVGEDGASASNVEAAQ